MTRAIACTGLLAAALLATSATAEAADKPVTLKEVFKDDFLVGAAVNRRMVTGTSGFRRSTEQNAEDVALLKEQFNQISPENDLKWQMIHPREGADGYDFGAADAFVNFGLSNKMQVVGHTLVWHSQTPNWVFAGTNPPPSNATTTVAANTNVPATNQFGRGRFGGGFFGRYNGPRASRDELLQRMREHIYTVVGRYKGKVKCWDVVNEAIADGPGTNVLRNSLWLEIIGPDFVVKAFQYAHEADPDAILRYNDYGLENPTKRRKLITLIKALQEQKVPVQAIGSQAHVNVSTSFETMDQTLTEMATLGLPIHITELDVNSAAGGQRGFGADITTNASATQGGLVSDADQKLADAYAGIFRAFVKHRDSVKVVTFWGVNDAVSWRRFGQPLLFDGDDRPKPAFDAVIAEAKKASAASPGAGPDTTSIRRTGSGFIRPADQPAPRTDPNSLVAHEQLLEKARKGGIDVYFLGDSITRRWGATDYPEFLANWNTNFFGWNAANFGWGADQIENILWRVENGELDGVHPRIIVVLAGINNVGTVPGGEAKVENITRGMKALVNVCQQKAPGAVIILTALFPRNDNMAVIPTINRINERIAAMADGKKIRYLNVNDRLADKDGKLFEGMSKDKLHPSLKGYQIWADGLKPIFTEILGPPAKTDHAPPPTGDPSARPSRIN